ncbi:hypothetical protein DFH09DRAFT_1435611 [Mycena vulgaris]|nr:hypothetical protein DFH09DRAFT_1435611 [Mycena vulgaris]
MDSENLRQTLADFDSSITEFLRQGLDVPQDLDDRRMATKLKLDRIIYPILTIPNEIIGEILILSEPNGGFYPSPHRAPLLFLRVCRAWRSIALSTPALWTYFLLAILDRHRRPERADLAECVQAWLARACTLPTSLEIYSTGTQPPECNPVPAVFRQQAPRVQNLHLTFEWAEFAALPDAGPLASLHTLTLWHVDASLREDDIFDEEEMAEGGGKQLTKVFRNALQLRDVTLGLGVRPLMFSLPWGQLTVFSAHGFTVPECLSVLRACPLLQKCRFMHMPRPRASVRTHPLIFHPSLQELTIEHAVGALVDWLDLPALHTLSLSTPLTPEDSFPPFLTRSSASLRTFRYSSADTWSDYVMPGGFSLDMFHTMNQLTAVELKCSGVESRPFLLALDSTEDVPFLPHLRDLELNCHVYGLDAQVIHALRSRLSDAGTVTKLRSLHLLCYCREDLSPAEWESLRGLAALGLEIHVGPKDLKDRNWFLD